MMLKKIESFLVYVLLILIILEFNTPYGLFLIMAATFLPVLVLALLILLNVARTKPDYGLVCLMIVGSVLPLLNVVEEGRGSFIRLFWMVLPLLTVYLIIKIKQKGLYGVKDILFKFSNIIVIEALISLFFWLLGSQLEIIPYTALIPNSWQGERFIPTWFGLYFETQDTMVGSDALTSVIRNSGCFNEAPMHNMVLSTALAIELFLRKPIEKRRIVILVITVVSTLTTTGYLLMLMMLLLKIYPYIDNQKKVWVILLMPVVLLICFFAVNAIIENQKNTRETSYNSRSGDIMKCIEVGMQNPLLGVGLFHKWEEGGSSQNNYGYSNSLFTIFAHGGIYTEILYVFSLFLAPFLFYRKARDPSIFLFFLCYFVLFSFTVSWQRYMTLLFMAIGIALWDVYILNRKKLNIH